MAAEGEQLAPLQARLQRLLPRKGSHTVVRLAQAVAIEEVLQHPAHVAAPPGPGPGGVQHRAAGPAVCGIREQHIPAQHRLPQVAAGTKAEQHFVEVPGQHQVVFALGGKAVELECG